LSLVEIDEDRADVRSLIRDRTGSQIDRDYKLTQLPRLRSPLGQASAGCSQNFRVGVPDRVTNHFGDEGLKVYPVTSTGKGK
jgi:hypothetical protein